MNFRSIALWAMAPAAVAVASPAIAAEEEPVTVIANNVERVSYADLDLTNAADREELHMRIRGAVRDVCGTRPRSRTERDTMSECADGAFASAEQQTDRAIEMAMNGSNPEMALIEVGTAS